MFGIKRQNLFARTEGSYSFTGVHTNDPVADYLLGLNASFYQEFNHRFRVPAATLSDGLTARVTFLNGLKPR